MCVECTNNNVYSIFNIVALLTAVWNLVVCVDGEKDNLALQDFLDESDEGPSSSSKKAKSSSSHSSSASKKKGQGPSKPPRQSSKVQNKPAKQKRKPPAKHVPPQKSKTIPKGNIALEEIKKEVEKQLGASKTPMEDKRQKIAKGAKKDENAYPTFDDIQSDWDDDKNEKIKPKKMNLDEKQKKIAMGAKKDTSAYPTMDDIESDWDSQEDEQRKEIRKKKASLEPKRSLIGPPPKKKR